MMKSTGIVFLIAAGLIPGTGGGQEPAKNPVKVIFDTDMDTDCDDAGALAMLHALADLGEVEILATMVSSLHRWSVPCVEAINIYYGRPGLPIGCPKGPGASTKRRFRYAEKIAAEFPASMKTNDDAPGAAHLYRKILSSQPRGKVVLVTVGYLTNLRDLLETKPDEHSPLAGKELIRRKVKYWVCMGGRYPRQSDPGIFGNFKPDAASSVAAVEDWPTPVFFTGIGRKILTGKLLRDTPRDNPVRRVYELYLGSKLTRPSWDQVAVLFAVRRPGKFWELHENGYNHINKNGTNEWRDSPDKKNHVLIKLRPGVEKDLTETIDRLMARPPASRSRSIK